MALTDNPLSPNLKLIERLWRFLKRQMLYNRYYETFGEFRDACKKFFAELDTYGLQLRTLLAENFPIIGDKNPGTSIAYI